MNNRIISLTIALVLALSTSAATIETDRTWYLAGEAIKVSVTADDASIAYAELCDTKSLAAGVVIGLKDHKGSGTIELPADLHSGYYVLSVYTRHSAKVESQLVAVVNPLRKSVDDDIEWVPSEESRGIIPEGQEHISLHLTPYTLHQENIRETEGHIIKARVKNVYNGHTYKASQIRPSIGIVGKQIHYFEGQMINDSTAVFNTYGIEGKHPLVLSAVTGTNTSLPIEMISPFAVLLPKLLPHLVFHYKRSEVEARSLDMQRHQRARRQETGNRSQETGDRRQESEDWRYDDTAYGTKPDLSYNLDEYRQFLTIREVLIEYVICVSNIKIDDTPQLIVHIGQAPSTSLWPSLVLIDGMPVINVERLLRYDARRVHYINIYGGDYTFGNGVYHGILSIVTRSGRLTNYPTEPNTQYLEYDFPE